MPTFWKMSFLADSSGNDTLSLSLSLSLLRHLLSIIQYITYCINYVILLCDIDELLMKFLYIHKDTSNVAFILVHEINDEWHCISIQIQISRNFFSAFYPSCSLSVTDQIAGQFKSFWKYTNFEKYVSNFQLMCIGSASIITTWGAAKYMGTILILLSTHTYLNKQTAFFL